MSPVLPTSRRQTSRPVTRCTGCSKPVIIPARLNPIDNARRRCDRCLAGGDPAGELEFRLRGAECSMRLRNSGAMR